MRKNWLKMKIKELFSIDSIYGLIYFVWSILSGLFWQWRGCEVWKNEFIFFLFLQLITIGTVPIAFWCRSQTNAMGMEPCNRTFCMITCQHQLAVVWLSAYTPQVWFIGLNTDVNRLEAATAALWSQATCCGCDGIASAANLFWSSFDQPQQTNGFRHWSSHWKNKRIQFQY